MSLDSRTAGFQGSEGSSAEVTIHTNADEYGLDQPKIGRLELVGRGNQSESPSLIRVSTQKALAGGAGTFEVTVKAPKKLNFRQMVGDDDWVDIVFSRHNLKFHVMRGLVDSVRRTTTVVNGATTQDWIVTGRDWQKIFEDTLVWFNRFAAENVWGGAALEAFMGQERLFAGENIDFEAGSVPANVYGFLSSMLGALGNFGRSTWELPWSLPGVVGDSKFFDNLKFNFDGFYNAPRRIAARPMFHSFQGTSEQSLWSLARQWSDEPFCELYTELLLDDGTRFPQPGDETGADLSQSAMTVVLRDRPFPTAEAPHGSLDAGPWWALPTYTLARQDVVSDDVGRSGAERKNTFVFQPQITQELMGQSIQVARPLWDQASVAKHGPRLHYVNSSYTALGNEATGVINLADPQRNRLRDWHCINHLFYNGTIQIPRGAPDLKIGCRLVVLDELSPKENETYYMESVGHDWALGPGLRTNLTVTRGVVGTDGDFRKLLQGAIDRFRLSDPARADDDRGTDP